MSGIPEGWRETTFGDVVRNVSINEKKLPKSRYSEIGRFPVIDQGQEFLGGYSDDSTKVVDADLPLLIFGDHTRIFKYLNQPFVPGADGIKVLKPVGVHEKWLYHIAHALEFPDKGYARHYHHLKQARLLVPPLPEQHRIVARIEELFSRLDAGVASLRHAKAQLKRYRQSVLTAAVTGQLTAEWREQHPDVEPASELLERILKKRREEWKGRGRYKEPAKQNKLPELRVPGSWVWTTLEALTTKISDGEHFRPNVVDHGVPFLSAKDVRDNGVRFDEVLYVTARDANRLRVRCNPDKDDVLIVSRGATVGRCCVVQIAEPFCLLGSVILLKVAKEIPSRFVLSLLKSPGGLKQLTEVSGSTAQQAIYLRDIKSLAFPLPPLAEQHQIVAEVEARTTAIDHLEVELDRQLARSDRLRQSILASAFKGELIHEFN